MKSLGLDPSSSVTGLGVAVDDELKFVDAFFADKNAPIEVNMLACLEMIEQIDALFGPFDVVVVEKVSVSWNVNTIRKISYFEAMGLLHGANVKSPVVQVQATKARRLVLGKGTLAKEDCHELVVSMFTTLPWKPKNKGGMDETDAAVLALAGPALLTERDKNGK